MANYTVDNKNNKIFADISKLTEKELEVIKKYKVLGYTIEVVEKKKITRLNEEYIIKYLKENAENSEKEIDTYKKAKEQPALDENGKEKTYTSKNITKTRTVGFNGGRNWFAKKYPLDINELSITDKQAQKINDLFEEYNNQKEKELKEAQEKNKNATIERMTKDEYTRYYYWNKIFKQ